MNVGRILAPLISRSTFRRGVHLLLGGVILIPYLLLAFGFGQMFADPAVPVLPVSVLVAVTVAIGTVPPFLPAMRGLEIAAARSLLDVPLPEPEARPPWEARWRAATWYVLHLGFGGVVVLTLLFVAPMSVVAVSRGLGVYEGWLTETNLWPFTDLYGVWSVLAGVVLIPALAYLVAGIGRLLVIVAPILLGPSSVERIRRLEVASRRLSERNRLARELHDSVGHALTVTTLQAAAAKQAIDSDPEFARRAMEAVEDAGRAAMEDLDHVLGLLRQDDQDRAASEHGMNSTRPGASRAPQRDLRQLHTLIQESGQAGLKIDAALQVDPATIPAATSREAYRIVQEGLTNALRHAGQVRVSLRIAAVEDGIEIEVVNPLGSETGEDAVDRRVGGREGYGLEGMRERVTVLRGELEAGRHGETWRVRASLPVDSTGRSVA